MLIALGIVTMFAGAAVMFAGNVARRRQQVMEATPISAAASVRPGRNAVLGTVEAFGPPETTPLTNRKCVWYSFKAEQRYERTERDGSKGTSWQTIEAKTWGMPFLVRDESGAVLVDPMSATMMMSDKNSVEDDPSGDTFAPWDTRSQPIKRSEKALLVGDPVYVLGHGGANTRIAKADSSLRLAPLELRQNGSDPFIISDRQPRALANSSRFWARFGIYGGAALAVAGLILTMIAPLL